MEPIYMLWLREVKRYTLSRPQILASLGQPLLYLLALGFGLGAFVRGRRTPRTPAGSVRQQADSGSLA